MPVNILPVKKETYYSNIEADSYIVLNNLAVYIREAVKLRNEIFSVSIDVI